MKRLLTILILMLTCFVLLASSCSSKFDGGISMGEYYTPEAGGHDADAAAPGEKGDGSDAETGEDDTAQSQVVQKPSGSMTAGAWNDNLNYELWKTLFYKGQTEEESQKFANVATSSSFGKSDWQFNSLRRVSVSVTSGGSPVRGISVESYDENQQITFSAVTDATGTAYLFCDDESGYVSVAGDGWTKTAEFDAENRDVTIDLTPDVENGFTGVAPAVSNLIEIMFVVDVTGSMGDEISYLTRTLGEVVDRIAAIDEQIVINLALLFYRDHGDTTVFDYYDFQNVTTDSGMSTQQKNIAKQSATGGGDTPEAVDEALLMAVDKQWSASPSTKIIFNVLDAPAHVGKVYEDRYHSAVVTAASKGIRICPVLASGADILTEYITRQAAIYTGGTFVFITDDSGIGNPHYDPSIPNVTVEFLNSLMVRLVKGYYTGTFDAPVDWRQEV